MSTELPHVLMVVNVDWFFLSHRLPIALEAKERGFRVTIAARDTGRGEEIASHGLDFVDLPISRDGTGVLEELRAIASLARLYRSLKPDVLHHVTIKPVLYGTMVANLVPRALVVNAISGMGYVLEQNESGSDLRATLRRSAVLTTYRLLFRRKSSRVILQNQGHVDFFAEGKLARPEAIRLIEGSGVDTTAFHPPEHEPDAPLVLLPARMLRDKGVMEFVEAARLAQINHPHTRFVLVGPASDANPTAIHSDELHAWVDEGIVEWWGQRDDMADVLRSASVVVLPTYHEGLPKVLLEAAACGRPIVATDIPGCRPIVHHENTGLLVPPKDAERLASAISRLLADPDQARAMGRAGRALALRRFSVERIARQTVDVYEEAMQP